MSEVDDTGAELRLPRHQPHHHWAVSDEGPTTFDREFEEDTEKDLKCPFQPSLA